MPIFTIIIWEHMDERKLVKGIINFDARAQERFFDHYRPRIYRSCVHLLGFQDREAEDIVQETFLIALKKIANFDFKCKLGSWLIQIAMNLCYERIRSRKRMILLLEKDIEAISNEKISRSADQQKERQAEKPGMLWNLTEKLGRICRKILDLRDQQGKDYVEISRKLRLPIGTVMSRVHRCRAMLKEGVAAQIEEGA